MHATAAAGPLTVVATLRGDFYGHAVADRGLADRLDGAVVNLGPPLREAVAPERPGELETIVRGPAERVGLAFQDGLVPRILEAVGDEPGNLPLLEFLLTELWTRRERGMLTDEAYDDVGGVEGAIAARARAAFDDLKSPEKQAAARRLFLSLVTPGEGREDTRARAPVPDDPLSQEIVRRFAGTQARLLVTSNDPTLGRTVEVSHEVLIRHWAELKDWVRDNRKGLRTRERIRQRQAEWRDKGEDPALLLPPGRPLEEGRQLTAQPGDVPVDDLRPFVDRSVARARRGQRRRLGAVAAAFVVLVAALGAALWSAQVARLAQERAETVAREALMQESRALAALANAAVESGDAVTGLLLALRGLPNLTGPPLADRPTHRPLNQRTLRVSRVALWDKHERAVLRGHDDGVRAAAFSTDGNSVVTASDDNTARLWDAETGAERAVLRGHEGPVNAAAFSPDGNSVVTASGGFRSDNTARLWDAQTGTERAVLRGHEGPVNAAAFSPDGNSVVTASDDKTARLWDAETGAERAVLRGHKWGVNAAAFSPDGNSVVTASQDGTARIWFVGKDAAAVIARACAVLPRDLTPAQMDRYGIDPDADWPCRERARTLWPHLAARE